MTKKERKQLNEILETLIIRSENYTHLASATGFSENFKSEKHGMAHGFSVSAKFINSFLEGNYNEKKRGF